MPEYRRIYIEGGTYFITLVTYDRQPIFSGSEARVILRNAWSNVSQRFPFITVALCLLPDHIHTLITLPENDSNYSIRIREIKRIFTRFFLAGNYQELFRNASRLHKNEASIWQRRFWEHTIFDEDDFNHHIDYIHYNPVKHGLVKKVSDWQWSSFHRYVKMGYYDKYWGSDYLNPNDPSNYGDV
jgi:putative transposase